MNIYYHFAPYWLQSSINILTGLDMITYLVTRYGLATLHAKSKEFKEMLSPYSMSDERIRKKLNRAVMTTDFLARFGTLAYSTHSLIHRAPETMLATSAAGCVIGFFLYIDARVFALRLRAP